MYKCYACGKEIAHPGESCPYCRFPVISTLHGEAGEEEQIRQFAEEYKKANPQYFTKIEPKAAAENTAPKAGDKKETSDVPLKKEAPKQESKTAPNAGPKNEEPKDTSGKPAEVAPAAAAAADSLEIDWKKRLEELLQREQQLKQKDEELRKREELQKQQEEKQKAEAEQRLKEEKERKILLANQEKLQEENRRKQEEENRKKQQEENQRRLQEENQRKAKEAEASAHKKKSGSGFLAVLFIGIICAGLYLYFKRPDLIEKWFGSEGTIAQIAESIQGKGKETEVIDLYLYGNYIKVKQPEQ